MSDLHDEIRKWSALPGPQRFLAALRLRLVNGGGTDRPLSFAKSPLTEDEQNQLIILFGNRGAVSADRVQLHLAQESLWSSRASMNLVDLVMIVHGPIVTRSERKQDRELRRMRKVAAERAALLAVMHPVPQLETEYRMLAALPTGLTSQVPEQSATRARRWSSYEAAIRAGAVWWPRHVQGIPTTERSLAATALKGSKKWTDAGRIAFQNLVRMPFDQAVDVGDTEVRLRGPLRWMLDDVIVDAHTGDPWVSIPARGALRLGSLEGRADGILLVENHASFTQVCGLSDVTDRWLCVWNKGFATDGLIDFVRKFVQWPITAWCDLDPSGIEIIHDIMRRTGREVYPVGMDSAYWHVATKRRDDAVDRVKWRERAVKLAESGPPRLRELAALMATTGERVEQESLEVTDPVVRTLADRLKEIRKLHEQP